MPPCPAPDRLDAYLDGELAPAEASAVARHAEECEACAAELALGRETLAALRSLPREACPEDVLLSALTQIERTPARAQDRTPVRTAPRARWGRLALAGAVAAGLALLTFRLASTPDIVPSSPEVALADPAPAPPDSAAVAPLRPETPPAPVARPDADAPESPAAPARPRRAVRRAPATPAAAPRDLVASTPGVDSAEARRAQEEVLLALALIADAHQMAGRVVGHEVGEAAGTVRQALPSRSRNRDTTIPPHR